MTETCSNPEFRLLGQLQNRQRRLEFFVLTVEESFGVRAACEIGIPIIALETHVPVRSLGNIGKPVVPESHFCGPEIFWTDDTAPIAFDHIETLLSPGRNDRLWSAKSLRR